MIYYKMIILNMTITFAKALKNYGFSF